MPTFGDRQFAEAEKSFIHVQLVGRRGCVSFRDATTVGRKQYMFLSLEVV